MTSRPIIFEQDQIYHIYNSGVDSRNIFLDEDDLLRFVQSLLEFNGPDPIGSIFENSFIKDRKQVLLGSGASKLVSIINFCLNPNHFHLSLRQETENGVQKFMQRLGTGYSKYFNNKYRRKGALLQGPFKVKCVDSNEYLLHLSSYINLNDRVHRLNELGSGASKWGSDEALVTSLSSWSEYVGGEPGPAQKAFGPICDLAIVLDQFDGSQDYREFAERSLMVSLEKKEDQLELKRRWLE